MLDVNNLGVAVKVRNPSCTYVIVDSCLLIAGLFGIRTLIDRLGGLVFYFSVV